MKRKQLCLILLLVCAASFVGAAEREPVTAAQQTEGVWGLGIFSLKKAPDEYQGAAFAMKSALVSFYAEIGMNPPMYIGNDPPETLKLFTEMFSFELDWIVLSAGAFDFRLGGTLLFQGFNSEKLNGEMAWRYTIFPCLGVAWNPGNFEVFLRASHSRFAPTQVITYKDEFRYPEESYVIGKIGLSYYF